MDFETLKERQKLVWGLGDYGPLSELLRPAAIHLCDACAVGAGQEVLDVAAGDGNFAIACAYEGAGVVATDLSPGMVERGRARSEAEGYDIEWAEADAEALPFEDARFDCVGSVFGAMLAPRPEVAVEEMFRVVRPGGTVGMTAWTPDGFQAQLFAIGRRYLPPPAGLPQPVEWGDEGTARSRFGSHAASFSYDRVTMPWTAESPEAAAELLAGSTPPQVAARKALDPEQYEQMERENLELMREWNQAKDGSLLIEGEYAVIVARRRG